MNKFNASTPAELRGFRSFGEFGYLNEYKDYWHQAIDFSHKLLALDPARDQAKFCEAFIAGMVNHAFGSFDVESIFQPYRGSMDEVIKALKLKPRGAQTVVYINESGSNPHWVAYIHAGGGLVRNVSSLSGEKCGSTGLLPGQKLLLEHEAFSARRQAMLEIEILENFSRIRDLDLKVGLEVVNLDFQLKGKKVCASFEIKSITPNGYLFLVNGKVLGSPEIQTLIIKAAGITIQNCLVDATF